uniref:Uncharacterized protein n=1 Tax=Rhizophora mucronata TaxID=61149 RepID=A0A2P2IXI5_RHIMU
MQIAGLIVCSTTDKQPKQRTLLPTQMLDAQVKQVEMTPLSLILRKRFKV